MADFEKRVGKKLDPEKWHADRAARLARKVKQHVDSKPQEGTASLKRGYHKGEE